MKLTYEDLLNDPSLMKDILAAARRERADTLHELVVLPITRLFTHQHAPRQDLARQG